MPVPPKVAFVRAPKLVTVTGVACKADAPNTNARVNTEYNLFFICLFLVF
jgi:hypothetical protein